MNFTAKVATLIALASIAITGLPQLAYAQSCTKLCETGFWVNFETEEIISVIRSEEDINAAGISGNSPLHHAAAVADDPSVIKALLDAGAELSARNDKGVTPLHVAAEATENPLVAKVLLDAGADTNTRENDGRTPLHLAAQYNENPLVVMALLDAGANAKARTSQGELPKKLASENPYIKDSQAYWRLNDLSYD